MSAPCIPPVSAANPRPRWLAGLLVFLIVATLPLATVSAVAATPDHLLISEVVTGGASASDELIELYNPTTGPLPLEGLELVYVSASGLTVSRRASWAAGAPAVPPFAHLLVANEAGVYGAVADVVYATGMAATGGSVALRIQGAATALDAVGWGTAAGVWSEGVPTPAPAAGSSIERLPGGAAGSGQDTDDNAADFAVRLVPDPQNSGSPPTPDPSGSPTATATVTATVTSSAQASASAAPSTPGASASSLPSIAPTPTGAPTGGPMPTETPGPSPEATMDLATARSLPDGTSVTVEAVALTDSTFADGGGYVADQTAGIAVLVTDGSFSRGERLRIRGTIDDRYAQRTIRATGSDILPLGTAEAPSPRTGLTGEVGEAVEGLLVRVTGAIVSGPTALSTGPAYDVDDGSGPVRVLVATATGIDTAAWEIGTGLDLVGVVGQRDSSGTGAAGYRLQPRDAADVVGVTQPGSASASASASPWASASPTAEPSPAPTLAPGTVTIGTARTLAKNARVTVRGVVTLPTGIVDDATAVIEDATGAIVLRLGDQAGTLARGRLVEVTGARSTKSGMETLRVTVAPVDRGPAAEPAPLSARTGDVGESVEARLVVVRGAVASPRRSGSGTVSFDVDDGSGALHVTAAAGTGFDEAVAAGDWVEVVGVVGQETSGAQPLRGYRLWPRSVSDVRVTAPAVPGGASGANPGADGVGGAAGGGSDLGTLGELGSAGAGRGDLEIGATLVATAWPELDVSGLLWDGERLVAIDAAGVAVIHRSIPQVTPPVPLRLTGLEAIGIHEATGIGVVTTRAERVSVGGRRAVPSTVLPAPGQAPRWMSLVGRLVGGPDHPAGLIVAGGARIALTAACEAGVGSRGRSGNGQVTVTGIGLAAPARLVVGCGGIRPAPALSVVRAAPASPEAALLTSTPIAGRITPAIDERRLTASLVMGVAFLLVVVATCARARLRRTEAERGAADGERDLDARDDVAGDGDAIGSAGTASIPTLTLVAVPRERGP